MNDNKSIRLDPQDFLQLMLDEFRRRVFEESYSRIRKCLDMLSEDETWASPNEWTNSAGNLTLHLMGNMRQWVCTGLGGRADHRKRSLEFVSGSRVEKAKLYGRMEELQKEVEAVLEELGPEDLVKKHKVQVYEENGASILVHVIEHFSYHTGQIALLAKLYKNRDLEFYPEDLETGD